MNKKFQEWKQAVKNPPADRLSKIEYRTHFLLIGAYIFAGVMLTRQGLWFIVPILIFSITLAYVNGITAFNKHGVIKQFSPEEKPEEFIDDISPTRKRTKIITYVYGEKTSWLMVIVSVITTILLIDPTQSRWMLMVLYPITIFIIYFTLYFGVMYWIALPDYKVKIQELKGGNENVKKEFKRK